MDAFDSTRTLSGFIAAIVEVIVILTGFPLTSMLTVISDTYR